MAERRPSDLSRLSDNDLFLLAERIDEELELRRLERERTLRARGGLLEADGPRYRNPDNPSETWSGRGPRPAWIEAARAKGIRLESLLSDDDRPVATPAPPRRSR